MKTRLQIVKKVLALIILIIIIPSALLAQWSSAVKLSLHSNAAVLNENMGRCIAVSGDTVHVVWSDTRSHGRAIYYKRSPDEGLTWNDETAITDTMGTAGFPSIAVVGSTVHLVWFDSSLGHPASFYKRSLDGGNTWGPVVCLDSSTKFWPGVAAYGSTVVVALNKEVAVGNTEVFFMSSVDNGSNWSGEVQISNAPNRSEDPSIAILGSDIHLSWNDKRTGTMEIYYRHSPDGGATWGPETALTNTDSYTTMVCLNGTHVDVPHAINNGDFNVWLSQSADTGTTWAADKQLTSDNSPEAYPYVVRNDSNLYMVYFEIGTSPAPWYLQSTDGGATWTTPIALGSGGQPFIAYTGCTLHVIWPDSGSIRYRRNPTGNCTGSISTATKEVATTTGLKLFPNPFNNCVTVQSYNPLGLITVCNSLGEIIYSGNENTFQQQVNLSQQAPGIYILSLQGKHYKLVKE